MSLSDALHLRLHGVDVPATVTGESMAGVILIGKFVPTSPLEPASSYQFSVSTAARDLGGTPLEGPVEINFTTADTSSIPTPSDTSSQPLAPQISALSPTSAAAGSPDLTLTITGTNFDGTAQNQGQVVWVANGQTTSLETTFVSSTQLTALVPAALLSNSGTIQVLLYRPLRSNMVSFLVIAPPPPLGQSTIIVNGQLSGYPAPLGFLGWREVSLDKSPSQTLREGGSVTFSPVAPGTHQLVLSNPCTWTHQPSGQTVTTVADQTVTVTVYVPPDCE